MKWTDYVLTGDIVATAQELNAQRDCLVRAIKHLEEALHHHNNDNFADARWGVYYANKRLEDWERSDKVIMEAHERFLDEERKRRKREKLIEELRNEGYHVVLIKDERRAN